MLSNLQAALPAADGNNPVPLAREGATPLHVAIVLYNPSDDGSVMTTTRRQAEWLAANHIEVTVIANQVPADWAVGRAEVATGAPGVVARCINYAIDGASRRITSRLSALETRCWLEQRAFNKAAARILMSLAQQRRVDAAICAQHFCASGLRSVRAMTKVPFIVVSHGDIFSHPSGSFSIPLTRHYRNSARIAYKHADHLITVGSALRERAIECGAPPSKVTVIPNGIDRRDLEGGFHPANNRRYPLELLYVGRLATEKGVDVLLKAIANLRGLNGRLRIVGDGPARSSLIRQSQQMSTEVPIEFTGSVPRNSLGAFYRSSDVVIVPSFSEAQGIVALEAATYGVPVVASRVGGLLDLIEDHVTGLLVSPGDAVGLRNAIQQLADSSELRRSIRLNAMQAATRFNWSTQLQRLHAVICDVCAIGAAE